MDGGEEIAVELSTDEESNRSESDRSRRTGGWITNQSRRGQSMTENQRQNVSGNSGSGGPGSGGSSESQQSIAQSPVANSQEKPNHQHYLNEFRVEACPLFKQHQCQQHRPFTCFKWHFANQRRRRPERKPDGSFNYSPDIYCDKYDENTGICPDGDDCIYLHRVSGDVERKYHLRYYKTAQCVHPTDSRGQCVKNGAHCAFAHTSNDLRQPMVCRSVLTHNHTNFDQHEAGFSTSIDGEGRDKTSFVIEDPQWHSQDHVLSCYKTEQCRKPARLCRQGYACPFYHNSKDRRRPPAVYKYRSTPCPAAKTIDEWLDPDICEAGDNCQYCHTRTEQQFHPEIYKSTKCNDMLEHGYCPRAVFCAFAHHDSELHAVRNPYVGSAQASPKEQCSPSSNGFNISTEQLRYDTPINNGIAPSYSAVLKQHQPISNNKVYATTDLISSSYPKAPGFERGPMSVGGNYDPLRNDQLGRLRTHSLNMGHLDIIRRNMVMSGGLSIDGTSLASHSSLCRSDSGFNVVTDTSLGTLDELSIDLPPIEESTNRQFALFDTMSSPICPPQQQHDPFVNASFFGQKSDQINSPHQSDIFSVPFDTSSIFHSDVQNGDYDEMNKNKFDIGNLSGKGVYDDSLKQAKQVCEMWKNRAEQAEMEKSRALYERDQALQQLETLRIHVATSGSGYMQQLPPMSSPLSIQATNSENIVEGGIRPSASLQHSPPYNIFPTDCDAGAPACARCGRDRSRSGSDSQSSCPVCSN